MQSRASSRDLTNTTLGDCAEFFSGGTPSKNNAANWGGDIPWVSAKDMKRSYLDDADDHVTELGAANGTRVVDENTILLLIRGMTLHNDVPVCMTRRKMAFNQDVRAIRAKPNVHPRFLFYWLRANKPRLLSLVDSASHGTGRIHSDVLHSLTIDLLPYKTQVVVSNFLADLDDKIELNRRMNETLEGMARAIFKSWFVDFDPVWAKKRGQKPVGMDSATAVLFPNAFEDSKLGNIPKGWKVSNLEEIAEFLNGLALQKHPPADDASLPVIKIAEMRRGNTSGSDRARADIDGKYIINDGDLLFSWSASLEVMFWCGGVGALNQHLFKVTPYIVPQWFVYCWLLEHLPEFRAIAAGKSTTMGHIQRHHLQQAMITVPPQALMSHASDLLGPITKSCIERTIESRTLATLRDTLLPKLMSGEIRVKDAEKIVGEKV